MTTWDWPLLQNPDGAGVLVKDHRKGKHLIELGWSSGLWGLLSVTHRIGVPQRGGEHYGRWVSSFERRGSTPSGLLLASRLMSPDSDTPMTQGALGTPGYAPTGGRARCSSGN